MLYLFEDCELEDARRTLVRHGREVHVEPKVMDLLVFLVRHRARFVSKGVLLREIWPDTIVSQGSLTRLVKEARRAIGDDGRRQRLLKTLHGRGYRFIADVDIQNGSIAEEHERALEFALLSLEAALETGVVDLRERVREFVETCQGVLRAAQE